MLKIAALLFNSIGLLLYQLLFVDTVTVTPNIPATATVGSEFTVQLTINKGSNIGFAKFQQDLPAGLTAVEGESNGGSFSFVNQSVKIIWMALPTASNFTITYKVKVAAQAVGNQTIAGKFKYVVDNTNQTIDIPPSTISITSESSVPAIAAVDSSQTTPVPAIQTNQSQPVAEAPFVNCFRKLPDHVTAPDGFVVEVTLKKGSLNDFGKLTETLPAGFTAMAVNSQGAVFSFEDHKATFIWSPLPSDQEFKISYKVKVDPSTSGEQLIEGVFAFDQEGQTLKYVLPPAFIKVLPPAATAPVAAAKPAPTPPPVPVPVPEPVVEPTPEPAPVASNTETPRELSATNVPTPQGGGKVHYKVQILALRKAKNATAIMALFKMSESVSAEMEQGYTKYTAGFHEEYKSARDARDIFTSNYGIAGPFVTAYNNGKRITVQEALMVTNQQWYK